MIDPVYNSPTISNPYVSKDTVFTTSANPLINFNASVKVDLNDGEPVDYVTCKLSLSSGTEIASINLNDNGVSPDSTAGDGRYSGSFNITNIQCLQVGFYQVQYFAKNRTGLFSNIINKNLIVVNTANQPPVLSNPILPDSVVRPPSGSFDLTISITTTDTDGHCDINIVFFDAYRSNGNLIGRIPMFYTNNNIYSYTAPVTYSNADSSYGYFKYVFQAFDNSNILSNVITDSIKFVRP